MFAVLSCFPAANACVIEGSYRLVWIQTHGGNPEADATVVLSAIKSVAPELLEGVQAQSPRDCRVDVASAPNARAKYLLSVPSDRAGRLGELLRHAGTEPDCYENDLFVLCRNASGQRLQGDCPEDPSVEQILGGDFDLARHFCSISTSLDDYFRIDKRIDVPAAEFIGAAAYKGIFRLERIDP